MRWTKRRQKLRTILAGNQCVFPASVFDPISARIAEDLGFEVGMFAGSVASMVVLGAPDLVVLTLSEFTHQAHRICRAAEMPLLVDADHGYGNALNVKRTVEELETAGVAALSIEDTVLPAAFGGQSAAQLVSVEEGIGKMKAALAGRQDSTLVIAGRTSAVGVNGVDDALKRIKAYERAGVDAVFLVGVQTRAELEALASAVKLPVILGSAGPELMDKNFLGRNGVRICLQGHQPFKAAVHATFESLQALRNGVPPADIDNTASAELVQQVTREEDYRRWMKDYMQLD